MNVVRHDGGSPFGRWTLVHWSPPELAGLVESIWHSDGFMAHPRERVLPVGRCELIVHLGARYREVIGAASHPYPATCFGGLSSRSVVIESPRTRTRVLGVQFHPAGAYALLRVPAAELAGRTVDLREVVGSAADELAERCLAARDGEGAVCEAARWIVRRVAGSRRVDPAIGWIAGAIERSRGRLPIAALRERAGLGRNQLADRFRDQIGIGPKRYARIARFRHALGLLHEGASELADAALAAGYYDQPHMSWEFRELCGLTPGQFLAAERYSSTSLAEG